MTRYYTLKDVADQLGVTRLTINRYMKKLNMNAPMSRFDRREKAISEEQLDLLDQAINSGPQPLDVDAKAYAIARSA